MTKNISFLIENWQSFAVHPYLQTESCRGNWVFCKIKQKTQKKKLICQIVKIFSYFCSLTSQLMAFIFTHLVIYHNILSCITQNEIKLAFSHLSAVVAKIFDKSIDGFHFHPSFYTSFFEGWKRRCRDPQGSDYPVYDSPLFPLVLWIKSNVLLSWMCQFDFSLQELS